MTSCCGTYMILEGPQVGPPVGVLHGVPSLDGGSSLSGTMLVTMLQGHALGRGAPVAVPPGPVGQAMAEELGEQWGIFG